jgi:hypothetical protein
MVFEFLSFGEVRRSGVREGRKVGMAAGLSGGRAISAFPG